VEGVVFYVERQQKEHFEKYSNMFFSWANYRDALKISNDHSWGKGFICVALSMNRKYSFGTEKYDEDICLSKQHILIIIYTIHILTTYIV